MIPSACPACRGELELHTEPDGDGSATWVHSWFECADCHATVEARNCGGDLQPVVDDEEDG